MLMVGCHQVKKFYGAQEVLSEVSFDVYEGEKVGLLGGNGAGKSTLFRLLAGSEPPDEGTVSLRRGAKVGVLDQIPDYGTLSVEDVLLGVFADTLELQERLRGLEGQMSAAEGAALEKMLREYGEAQEAFERSGGYEISAKVDAVTLGLGIPASHRRRPFAELSGGEKTKVSLAALLLGEADLLLLDEPTNHLDMEAAAWLEGFIRDSSATIVVISHDRYFLTQTAEKIVELEDGEATVYPCGYAQYREEREARLLRQFEEYKEQQKVIKQMKEAIKRLIEWGKQGDNPKFFRKAASMQKALERMEKIKRPVLEPASIGLSLEADGRTGEDVLTLQGVRKAYGGKILLREADGLLRYGERAVLIGGNGAGKTTLMRMVLGLESPDGGELRLGSRVKVGYLAQEESPPQDRTSVLDYYKGQAAMEEGEARGRLAKFLFYGKEVFKPVAGLSGGEWSRLRLAVLMRQKPNLLLLDEPTNHLDIASREALEEALEEYDGTVLAVSHDRFFINRIAQRVWALEGGTLGITLGGYDDYREERRKAERALTASAEEGGAAAGRGGKAGNSGAAERMSAGAARGRGGSGASGADRSGNGAEAKAGRAVNTRRDPAKLERKIAVLEARSAELGEALLDPAHALDARRLSEWLKEKEETDAKIDALTEEWLALENK
ncbi:ribosomal protection-like ABC-F family protein [Saccharibacillus alkalitolerans]|uniref:ABC-F family ATP-binding cassette domain-containing protein n=1 Tax=Saccharibacillus alkalitolerans TaxID=2705290 RepID=A0ABX0F712_9BACL|nr:ABC-F family ATP-binding cassette domain-containing protein [Saccharibacillus alkalitolerans]NGZ76220.1 ABC-F family ATP-binding cassette domain-containing protein [Saccharibacillus alkalitolerans]